MKTMKNYIWMAAIAMTAATLTACSNNDLVTNENPAQKNNVVTLTATLSPKGGDEVTRALTDPGDGTISSAWAVDEELLVSYQKTDDSYDYVKVKVSSIDGSGNAIVTLNLDDPKDGSDIDFNYPYTSAATIKDYYYDQLGTLADISQNYDLCHGDGVLNVDGGIATLAGKVTMTRNVFIWKFTFTDGSSDITNQITSLVIDDGGGYPYTISPNGQSVIYVAMTSNGAPADISITAATGTGIYTKTKAGVTLDNGKLYTSNAVALTSVAAVDLSSKTANYTATSGDVLTGTLDPKYKLIIPMDAVVMLKNATIGYGGYDGAAIKCLGNATIVIADGTTNSVTVPGGNDPDMSGYPGILPGAMGTRLTIKGGYTGNGTLNVVGGYIAAGIGCTNSSYNDYMYGDDSGDYCGVIQIDGGVVTVTGGEAGIGSVEGGSANDNCEGIIINGGSVTATGTTAGIGSSANCGFITINGGTVNANGTQDGPGIGAGPYASCGDITINGGTITAIGNGDAAGIGSSSETSNYTSLTIASGIIKVTATRGANGTAAPIGRGKDDATSPDPVFSGVTKDAINSTADTWIYE